MRKSKLLDYLLRLISTGQDLPATVDELPAPWNKWIKDLSTDQNQATEPRVRSEIERLSRLSLRYATRMKGASEEAHRASANRLYYAIVNVARYRFGEDLKQGFNAHNSFASHLLRAAVEDKTLSLDTLFKWEEARWLLYSARIRADYDLVERFFLDNREEHIQSATMIFNALSNLKRDEASPAT